MIEHQVAMAIHHLSVVKYPHSAFNIDRRGDEIDCALSWLKEGQDIMNADRIAKELAKEKEKSMSDSLHERRAIFGEFDGEENTNVR